MIVHHHKYFLENGYIEVKGAPAVKLNKKKKSKCWVGETWAIIKLLSWIFFGLILHCPLKVQENNQITDIFSLSRAIILTIVDYTMSFITEIQ